MNATTMDDPAAIERDIRETQDNMSKTVDRIGEQLSVKNLFNALVDKAGERNINAQSLMDGARRNPMAVGLIAAGAIWLATGKTAKLPSIGKRNSTRRQDASSQTGANSISGRNSNGLVDRLRQKGQAWSGSSTQARDATAAKTRQFTGMAQDKYGNAPLVGGVLAAAVGAIVGAGVPISRTEQEKLRPIGEKARSAVKRQKKQVTAQLRDKKDELLEKADEKLKSVVAGGNQGSTASDTPADDTQPFIARS